MREHEKTLNFLKEEVLKKSQHEVQLCLDIYRDNSLMTCDFFEFDIAKIRYVFCWNHADFVAIHMFLTGANSVWYDILEHLENLRLINMTRTTTEFWPDIHGTTKPVNLNFHLDSEYSSDYDTIPSVE